MLVRGIFFRENGERLLMLGLRDFFEAGGERYFLGHCLARD